MLVILQGAEDEAEEVEEEQEEAEKEAEGKEAGKDNKWSSNHLIIHLNFKHESFKGPISAMWPPFYCHLGRSFARIFSTFSNGFVVVSFSMSAVRWFGMTATSFLFSGSVVR